MATASVQCYRYVYKSKCSETLELILNQKTFRMILESDFYRLQTKLQECNVFTHVCLFTGHHKSGRYASYWNALLSINNSYCVLFELVKY